MIRINSLRILMIIIIIEDIKEEQMNVNNIFIEFKFHETIYIKSFFGVKIHKDVTLRLRHSLYDLKQSTRE